MELEMYDKFEYQVKSFRDTRPSDLTSKLNDLGNEGWELVNIVNGSLGIYYIFKRKLTVIK